MRHSLHTTRCFSLVSMTQTVRMKSAVCNGPKIYLDWYKLLLNKYTIGQVSIIYSAETNKQNNELHNQVQPIRTAVVIVRIIVCK